MIKDKTIETKYVKHNPIEAILARPDTFIGSDQKTTEVLYVYNEEKETMVEKEINYTPGFIKIFDEVLSNAVDHSTEDPNLKKIEVTIDKKTGLIKISNDGKGIPVVIHKKYNKYVPELIFGELNTSSNYDDSEKRIKAGRNGVGVKLASIFSKLFVVETIDEDTGLKFYQEHKNNMGTIEQCKIAKCKNKGKTTISFLPDYNRFSMKGLEEDSYQLLVKRVYDAIPCTNSSVSIYLNGTKLKGKDFESYIKMYSECQNVITEYIEEQPFSWHIGIGRASGQETMKQVSFVNGVCTTKGGTHVNYVVNQFIKRFIEFVQKKRKLENIKPQTIKDNIFVFVKLVTENPKFNSQTKEELITNSKDFSIKYKFSDEFIQKVYKKNEELVAEIVDLTKFKTNKELAKNDGSGTRRQVHLNIPKLDDAHFAGTATGSQKCTLILVEGDSAKQFAIQGITTIKDGRKYFGVFPLKGKVMNVQKASETKSSKNEEIANIIKIMGLQYNKKYTDTTSLRYGKVMILTDSDHDGSHIKGLVMNLFKEWWPELYNKKGFLTTLNTPIIKVTNKNNLVAEFYSQYDYQTWSETNYRPSYNVKYYKGLGSSTNDEVKSIFKNFERNYVEYFTDKDSMKALDLAFNDKLADSRKEWLKEYKKENVLEFKSNNISCTEFINKGLIHFSMADNIRSIPGIDGLKPSQRKILHTMFEKAFNKEVKVSNLSGKVAEFTEYHHGDASLQSAIVTLAQNFIGTNNYNLLEPIGQLGTRVTGQAAQSRYIFVKLSEYSKLLFHQDDFKILNYLENEGATIEPEFYMPLVPVSLLNGCQGIGTGYSTFIPPFKYSDVTKNIKILLKTNDPNKLDDLFPWYRHYTGDIEALDNNKFILNGDYKITSANTIKITELPVGVLTDTYKDDVIRKKLIETGIVKYMKENSTTEKVDIDIEFYENISHVPHQELVKLLKLTKQISCNNYYLFDENYKIKYYPTANDILIDFVTVRLRYYTKRKTYLLNFYSQKEVELYNKIRFLNEIITEKLVIFKKSGKEVEKLLTDAKYDKINGEYSYLRQMAIDSFTKEKIDKFVSEYKEIKGKIDFLKSKTERELYLIDLENLDKYIKE